MIDENSVEANLPPKAPEGTEIVRIRVAVTLSAYVMMPIRPEWVDNIATAEIPMAMVRDAVERMPITQDHIKSAKLEVVDVRRMEL